MREHAPVALMNQSSNVSAYMSVYVHAQASAASLQRTLNLSANKYYYYYWPALCAPVGRAAPAFLPSRSSSHAAGPAAAATQLVFVISTVCIQPPRPQGQKRGAICRHYQVLPHCRRGIHMGTYTATCSLILRGHQQNTCHFNMAVSCRQASSLVNMVKYLVDIIIPCQQL